jgi:hypothetical protein
MSRFTCVPGRLAGAAVMAGAAALAPVATLAAPDAADAVAAPHLIGCDPADAVRPAAYNPVCNDGAGTVVGLHWSRWSRTAAGTGKFFTHTCVPSCAQDTGTLYRVSLAASRVRGGDYTRLRYTFPGRVPAGFSRSFVSTYSGHQWHGKVV